jgi:hypothetical protein
MSITVVIMAKQRPKFENNDLVAVAYLNVVALYRGVQTP